MEPTGTVQPDPLDPPVPLDVALKDIYRRAQEALLPQIQQDNLRQRNYLRGLIQAYAYIQGQPDEFLLVGGQRSSEYLDCARVTLHPEAMPLIGKFFLQEMVAAGWIDRTKGIDYVGGPQTGAIPITCSIVAHAMASSGYQIRAFSVRSGEKDHGPKSRSNFYGRLDGMPGGRTFDLATSGARGNRARAVLVDDVCTTGASLDSAATVCVAAGMDVVGICVLVDRFSAIPEDEQRPRRIGDNSNSTWPEWVQGKPPPPFRSIFTLEDIRRNF